MNYCEECQDPVSDDVATCMGCRLDIKRRLGRLRDALLRAKRGEAARAHGSTEPVHASSRPPADPQQRPGWDRDEAIAAIFERYDESFRKLAERRWGRQEGGPSACGLPGDRTNETVVQRCMTRPVFVPLLVASFEQILSELMLRPDGRPVHR